jgi:hypothetical protein
MVVVVAGSVVVVVIAGSVLPGPGIVVVDSTIEVGVGSGVVVVDSVAELQAATNTNKTTACDRIPVQLMPSLVL